MKIQETLQNWGDVVVTAITEEEINDIERAVVYCNHGDDFLLIRTKDGDYYKYGWFLNRTLYPDYDELAYDNSFIVKPHLYNLYDKYHEKENEIFELYYATMTDRFTNRVRHYEKEKAIEIFEDFKVLMYRVSLSKYTYNAENYKERVRRFLVENDILDNDTEEILERIKWSSRINGFDGTAGKIISNGSFKADGIISLYGVTEEELAKEEVYDGFGFCSFIVKNF